jgi:hypothetical protein
VRYTLVPVPSEYVLDVMRFVLFRAPDEDGQSKGRNKARVVHLLDTLDDFKRSLLVLVATSVVQEDSLQLRDAAEQLNQPPQVVSEDVLMLRAETVVGIHGQTGKHLSITMRPDIARFVVAASRSANASGE